MWLLVYQEFKCIECPKPHCVQPGQSIRPTPIVEFRMNEEFKEVDTAAKQASGEEIIEIKHDSIALDATDLDGAPGIDGVGEEHQQSDFEQHVAVLMCWIPLPVFLGGDPLDERELLEDKGDDRKEGKQGQGNVGFICGDELPGRGVLDERDQDGQEGEESHQELKRQGLVVVEGSLLGVLDCHVLIVQHIQWLLILALHDNQQSTHNHSPLAIIVITKHIINKKQQQEMMYRQEHKQENRSNVRGLLSKQFYLGEQAEVQRKRREMKERLDEQIEERRRKKEREEAELERRNRQEEEEIRTYYANLQERDRKNKEMKQPYQTFPIQNINPLGMRNKKHKAPSKLSLLQDGDMPVMGEYYPHSPSNQDLNYPKLKDSSGREHAKQYGKESRTKQSHTKQSHTKQSHTKQSRTKQSHTKQSHTKQSYGNIVLLDLSEGGRNKKAKASQSKREEQNGSKNEVGLVQSRQAIQLENEYAQENMSLKNELKKSQEAISLLIGAVRSHGKLDRFRVQAEKILSGEGKSQESKSGDKSEDRQGFLPKVSVRHQSIMHDFMIGAARKGKRK